jgi:hypothetical protein
VRDRDQRIGELDEEEQNNNKERDGRGSEESVAVRWSLAVLREI